MRSLQHQTRKTLKKRWNFGSRDQIWDKTRFFSCLFLTSNATHSSLLASLTVSCVCLLALLRSWYSKHRETAHFDYLFMSHSQCFLKFIFIPTMEFIVLHREMNQPCVHQIILSNEPHWRSVSFPSFIILWLFILSFWTLSHDCGWPSSHHFCSCISRYSCFSFQAFFQKHFRRPSTDVVSSYSFGSLG